MYSKYPEVIEINNMTASTVVRETKAVFARHGVARIIYTDNGTQFMSREFTTFSKEWGFILKTSSAMYSQSNGFIERHVQTIKNLIKKAKADNKDFL